MLYFGRIDVSEGIQANKRNSSRKRNIFHYGYFLDKGFKFQPYGCNGCHDVLMMSINFKSITILNICGVDYCSIINGIDKKEVINLLQNVDLT